MRVKVTGQNSFIKVISLDKDDMLQNLLENSAPPFKVTAVRFGYPPQTICISEETVNNSVDSLGISSGEKVTLIGETEESIQKKETVLPKKDLSKETIPTQTIITLPDNSTDILRVHKVPDDNSCLFHSISYCTYKDISISQQLRSVVAEKVRADPIEYSAAVLDKPNHLYADWILRKDSWGGGIEIAILSEALNTAIFVLDMDAQQFEKFNEDKFSQFMIILFNGIHYDAIELSNNQTIFNKDDGFLSQLILSGSLQIAKQLKKHGYSFNTKRDKIVCNVCHAKFTGERDVARHAEETGHVDFGQSTH